MTVFLSSLSGFMVVPAITDITMAAVCPGKDECSLAIYLTGIQHAVIGMGSLVMMPMVGNLSDAYGRKTMLTIPLTLSIFPLAILAYSRSRYYYYAYYVLRTLIGMLCDGSVHCLALAYVADKVGEGRRASVFGILSGVSSSAFICGSLSSHFMSTASTFQVAGIMAIVALVYMKIFLPESLPKEDILVKATETECLLEKAPKKNFQLYKRLPSFDDLVCLLRTSPAFLHVAVVSFLSHVAETGLNASLFLVLMPILAPAIGEERLLSVGLFFCSLHMLLHSIAWSPWVPYAAALMSVLATFGMPCLRSIASKQFGPNEQGKVQGCVTGLSSFANIVSPLAFSPLIATFLSDDAPFHFPGFSIMIAGLAASLMMITSRSATAYNLSDSNSPRNFV
nr:hippocampus abundant transcript 1 protein-like [Ipomoea trifida]